MGRRRLLSGIGLHVVGAFRLVLPPAHVGEGLSLGVGSAVHFAPQLVVAGPIVDETNATFGHSRTKSILEDVFAIYDRTVGLWYDADRTREWVIYFEH